MSNLTAKTSQKTNAASHLEITITLEGNLDNSTVANFQSHLTAALAVKPAQLIFDLANLKYVTSSGMRLFFSAAKQQKQHTGQVSFVNLQPQIAEVFDIIGKLPEMRVFKNQAELDGYLLLGDEDGGPFAFNNDADLDVYLRARQGSYPPSSPSEK